MALLSIKGPGEVIPMAFDFCALIAAGDTIASASCTVVVQAGPAGQDLSGMLVGAAAIDGGEVTQMLGGGRKGSVYRVTCTATMASGAVFELAGDVPCNTVFGA